jgi:type IV pilus assembly protein PilQ
MTVTQAQRARHARFLPGRAALAGLAAGMLAAFSVQAAPANAALPLMAASTLPAATDPARALPGAVSVSKIDFRRGEGGAGQLVLSFSGDGAMPDLHNESSGVVIDIGNASLPPSLQKPLDVTDFATPVQRIDANRMGTGTRVVLDTRGAFESMAYQTGTDYIVEVMPRAVAPAVAATGQVVGAATAAADRTYSGRPVTFNFQDVPVRAVLQIIAEEAKLNLVASDTVSGNVTLRLVNVPWDQALDIVLRAKGLDKRRSGNVVWVAPQSEIAKYEQDIQNARLALENSAEMTTEYIPINYGNAEDIANLLTENSKGGSGGGGTNANQGRGFLSPRGSISFDQRTNTLLVIDIPKRVEAIRQLVNELDKPVDQVVIEARIVVANESFARELGARFGISGASGKPGDRSTVGFGGDLESSADNAQSRADAVMDGERSFDITRSLMTNLPSTLGGSGALALSILNAGHMLDIELSALQQEGRGEVISNPRIVTSNPTEAVIKQGDQIG